MLKNQSKYIEKHWCDSDWSDMDYHGCGGTI